MDILKLIKKDHREVKQIIKKLESVAETPGQETFELVARLMTELKLHSKAEEQALYEACKKKSDKLHDFSLEGYIEHRLMEVVLNKLAKTVPGKDGEFKALLSVVTELIEHHAEEEEEKEMFPKIERAFSTEERGMMGDRMQAIKDELRPKIVAQTQQRITSAGAIKPSAEPAKPSKTQAQVAH